MIDKKIFLIGFMGAGKTFFGEQLATKMELQFYDFDRKIEKKTKLNIKQLFEQKGENAFRKIESDLILNWKKFGIISTGAGIIENIENQTILKQKNNLVIWLDVSWEIVKSRIVNSDRPLVLNHSFVKLKQLFQHRHNLYKNCADIIYRGNSVDELQKIIENSLND